MKTRELTKEQKIRRGRKLMKKLILEELAKRKRDKKIKNETPPKTENDSKLTPDKYGK